MCIDYSSLNKVCPKDEYPLPHIGQKVDSTTSFELLSFLDAYSGYHQINLAIDNEEKIAFITPFGIFCYTKMTFNLKNGGSTYQKGIQIILETQIGRNVEAYIDDVVVKSKNIGIYLTTSNRPLRISVSTRWCLNLKNVCPVYHQANCSAIWYQLGD
jgi:hypothetical protein